MVDNTHKDPAKQQVGYNCGNKSESAEVTILNEILVKLCNLELPELSGIADILLQLQAICDKLLELPNYTASFDALCEKLAGITTSLEALCEKIEGSNDELCEKIEKLLSITNETLTCLNQIKVLNQAQLDCLKDLKAQGLTLQECLDEIKKLNSDQLACLTSLKEQGLSILECLQILKDLSYTECCVEADPENRDRWCFSDKRTYPFGNGEATTIYSVQVDGGGYITLPNPYTQDDLLSALNQQMPGANFTTFEDQICRYDEAGSVQFRTITCRDKLKAIGQSTAVTSFVGGEDPECKKYLDVLGKYDEPIADNVANIDANLQALLEKTCESQVDCLRCAKFVVDPGQVVNNVVTGVQGSGGSITMLAESAAGAVEFAAQVELLGYNVESVIGNEVTVCGTDIIFSYQLADETIVPADELFNKQGQLVCDPSGTAAICGKLDQLIALESANLEKQCEILACLKCESTPPANCVATVSSPNNPAGFSWTSGPSANQPVVFPTPIDTPQVQDLIGFVKTDCEALNACFPACATAEFVRMRVTFAHRQLGSAHSGFVFSAGAGASVVGVSPSNTTALTPSNSSTQQIGTAAGDSDDAGYVDRWVDVLVPKAILCSEQGWQIATGGFQGFDTASVFDESLNSIKIDIIGCE